METKYCCPTLEAFHEAEGFRPPPGAVEVPLQHVAGVTLERLAREVLHVAEHPGDGSVVTAPRDDVEGVGIGHGQHVRLLDPAVALDRRAVEGHALLEGALELRRRDGEALERAEDVGEPEPDEPDPALLDGAHHVVELAFHQTVSREDGPSLGRCA